jgi:hypothetical protein
MREHRKTLFALSSAVVALLGFTVTDVMAASSAHRQLRPAAVHRLARVDSANGARVYDSVGPVAPVPAAYRGPAYPSDACNLPTSACPNQMRDGQ